jgi:hypothetical protein
MKRSLLAASVLATIAVTAAAVVSGRASAAPVDTIPPTCTATLVAGPPTQANITVADAGSGIASVVVTVADNADVPVPPFIVGTTTPLIVTATKIDQSKSSTVAMRITDVSGNTTFCQVVFGSSGSPTVTVDSAAPTCGVIATVGPPAQATFTVQDVGTGLASVVVTQSDNADTPVPPFVVGDIDPLVITATKIDQSKSSAVTLVITDLAGFQTLCGATFLPLNVVAARVRAISATAAPNGVRVRWRTASEAGIVGFNVYRSVGLHRTRVNSHLLAARGGAGGHAYSYLVRAASRAARYWVQAVAADGTRTWFGPARVVR